MSNSNESKPTPKDWGRIHAKAWTDPRYRELLETDPTAALKQYADENGKKFDKILTVTDRPEDVTDDQLQSALAGGDDFTSGTPSCC